MNILLPGKIVYTPVVPVEKQQEKLDVLNKNITNESFYFVFNLLTCELENVNGVDKWLGYSEKEFTVKQYLRCIHPDHIVLFNLLARNMYELLCKGFFKLRFSTQKYISLVALRHYDGEYYVYKKTTSVFQYDDHNRLLAQLNEFNKIELYDGTPLRPRFTETEGLQSEHFERSVFQMVLKHLMEEKYFSEKEFEVLQYYAANEDSTSNDVAKKLDIKAGTIDTYNKRILEKARSTFTYHFNNAREVALRLKKEKILG